MRKLRLDIESLSVESFSTAAPLVAPGTVHGNGTPSQFNCTQQYSCATHCAATGCPVQSIDIGCISDPTRCGCAVTEAGCD